MQAVVQTGEFLFQLRDESIVDGQHIGCCQRFLEQGVHQLLGVGHTVFPRPVFGRPFVGSHQPPFCIFLQAVEPILASHLHDGPGRVAQVFLI